MNWRDLLQVRLTEAWGIQVTVGWLLIALAAVAVGAFVLVRLFVFKRRWGFQTIEAEIKLGGIGTVKIKPNHEAARIAHMAWVELATRKAALPFDEHHDVIAEVYNSWYELFGRIRDLVKQVPIERIRSNEDTRKLVILLVDSLNKGLRPHLTQWQAKFRRWYEHELDTKQEATPQEIQRTYPAYTQLVADLKRVNSQLVDYAALLKRISEG
jgi:hypothetical protein